jgi:hypothetical protein
MKCQEFCEKAEPYTGLWNSCVHVVSSNAGIYYYYYYYFIFWTIEFLLGSINQLISVR